MLLRLEEESAGLDRFERCSTFRSFSGAIVYNSEWLTCMCTFSGRNRPQVFIHRRHRQRT